jgi:hypothetical protein
MSSRTPGTTVCWYVPRDEYVYFVLTSASQDDDESDDEDEEIVPQFSCPMCHKTPQSVCCAPCGHIFCSPYDFVSSASSSTAADSLFRCIAHTLKQSSACPVCLEPSAVEQLRKIFLV